MPLHAFAAARPLHSAVERSVDHPVAGLTAVGLIAKLNVFFVIDVGVETEAHGLLQTFESRPIRQTQKLLDPLRLNHGEGPPDFLVAVHGTVHSLSFFNRLEP
jgi:hypothetical protein